MDYEKEFKSLVAKIKKAHQFAQTDSTKNVLEDILPELRESEDERIRKSLINFLLSFELMRDDATFRKGDFDLDAIKGYISYLEKQKEQKPDDIKSEWWNKGYLEGRKNAHIPAKELGLPSSWDFQKEQKPDIELIQRTWYMEGYQDREHNLEPMWIVKIGEGGPRYEDNPKYGQPLPLAEEQKSTEIDEIIRKARSEGRQEVIDNPEYYQLLKIEEMPKPAEWSEEDEKKIIFLERLIKYNVPEGQYGYKDGAVTKLGAIAMLKSLRPSWKPSEEQMKELKEASAIMKYDSDDNAFPSLKTLYEQLKKL